MIEDRRLDLGIQEYSISETTLEQIFQMFANQSIAEDRNAFVFRRGRDGLVLANPDHGATDDQKELSERGLTDASSRRSSEASRDPAGGVK